MLIPSGTLHGLVVFVKRRVLGVATNVLLKTLEKDIRQLIFANQLRPLQPELGKGVGYVWGRC